MKLFFYYALHSIKNQIKKLFKTWVAILLLVCIVIGVLVGIAAVIITDELEDTIENPDPSGQTQEEEDEEPHGISEEEKQMLLEIIELVILGATLLTFTLAATGADKSGSVVFLSADVNLLFPSPMKPQSVLLFRLMTQIGTMLAASIYIIFQLPNFCLNLGCSVLSVLGVFFAWILILAYGRLLRVLLYSVFSTNGARKRRLRPTVYTVLGAILVGYLLYAKLSGDGFSQPYQTAVAFFNHPVTRYIPVIGWLKGFAMYAIEGNLLGTGLTLAGLLGVLALMIYVIWHLKPDFYEDAMAKSSETAELRQAVEEGRKIIAVRKKERGERFSRDMRIRGSGANVYFFKTLSNRYRFAHFHFSTATMETYFLVSIAVALLQKFAFDGGSSILPTLLVLGLFSFFRSLGNPWQEDVQMDSFRMVPANAWAKLFWSLLGGSVCCALDLLPGLVAAVLILQSDPLPALLGVLFLATLDFYSCAAGAFIQLSVPTSAGKNLKTVVQVLFIYFGLLPDVVVLTLCMIFDLPTLLFFAFAILANLAFGGLFYALAPLFLERGTK